MRSSSVSLSGTGRNERGEKMGVLKTVQLHTRSRHVFAPVETLASAKERLLAEAVDLGDVVSRPLLVRRNSTSAPLSPLLDAPTPVPLPVIPPVYDRDADEVTVSFNPVPKSKPTTQSVTPPPTNDYIATLLSCEGESSASIVKDTIEIMLQDPFVQDVDHFNAGLRALYVTRRIGDPLTHIIRLYNAMLDKSVVPNIQTYETLILALTNRDFEVHHAILSIESKLADKHPLFGRVETAINTSILESRLRRLKLEDNFGSAMSLFEGVLAAKGTNSMYLGAFTQLIRSCAFRANVSAAVHVFAQLERRRITIDHPVYRNMIVAFSNARMIKQAEEIFTEFLKPRFSVKSFPRSGSPHVDRGYHLHSNRHEQIKVWNAMIEAYFRAEMPDKAVGLLGRMLASTATNDFGPNDIPIVTPSTFKVVIAGFLRGGDTPSALSWFERLLEQKDSATDHYQGLGGAPMRPDMPQWRVILHGLAKKEKIDDLNRLYRVMRSVAVQDRLNWGPIDQLIVYSANMRNLGDLDNEAAFKILNFIAEDIAASSSKVSIPENLPLISSLALSFIQRGQFLSAAEIMRKWYTTVYETNTTHQVLRVMQNDLNHVTQHLSNAAKHGKGVLDYHVASILVKLHTLLGLDITYEFGPWYLHTYGLARLKDDIDYSQMTPHDWNLVLNCAVEMEAAAQAGTKGLTVIDQYAFKGVASLLEDIVNQGLIFSDLDEKLGGRTIEHLQSQLGDARCQELLSNLDPSYLEVFNRLRKIKYSALESALNQNSEPIVPLPGIQNSSQELIPLTISLKLSDTVDIILRHRGERSVPDRIEQAYALVKSNLQKREGVDPYVLAYLIQSCGRNHQMDRAYELYTIGQSVLQCVAPNRMLSAWVCMESSMIIALGHSGNVDAAHVHRLRVLDQGCTPSADAYGVLIQHVKDTTDDTSGAVALFQEAMEGGTKPNLFLYNNIISKLARARKADYALEIFSQMKLNDCLPSCVTYATVIGACARVGDVQLAEKLFAEMTAHVKPRVPAFNSLMQLFTTSKPNRTSSLYYYNQLLGFGLKPSSYTYKVHRFAFFSSFVFGTDRIQLLMDTYGCLEPVDLSAMEKVFQKLQEDPDADLTSGHFATLINAYGCVAKDFDKAIAIFQSIPTHPRAPPLDAVTFEAVINVLVAHRRTDLLPIYVSKMNEAGVHMTAYIANFLIKGYANIGDLDQARSIFESLRDPPSGVAAPNNHAPHHPELSPDVNIMDVVYREVRIFIFIFLTFFKNSSSAVNMGNHGTRRARCWKYRCCTVSTKTNQSQVCDLTLRFFGLFCSLIIILMTDNTQKRFITESVGL